MKQVITPAQRLQLHGLYALADAYSQKEQELLDAAYELLDCEEGEGEQADHISDALLNGDGRDDLLDRLGIRVADEVVEEEKD